VPEPEPAPATPGRATLFWRRALRWAVGFLAVFALGLAATWVTQVQPKAQLIETLNAELKTAQDQVASLQKQVTALQDVQAENASLQQRIAQEQRHRLLLQTLLDVTHANLSLTLNDPTNARAALAETDTRLATISQGLTSEQVASIQATRKRLALVLGELSTNTFAAEKDLEVMASDLTALEKTLFFP
jgi:DNA repair exonuclease SbcCD ATPase subunit